MAVILHHFMDLGTDIEATKHFSLHEEESVVIPWLTFSNSQDSSPGIQVDIAVYDALSVTIPHLPEIRMRFRKGQDYSVECAILECFLRSDIKRATITDECDEGTTELKITEEELRESQQELRNFEEFRALKKKMKHSKAVVYLTKNVVCDCAATKDELESLNRDMPRCMKNAITVSSNPSASRQSKSSKSCYSTRRPHSWSWSLSKRKKRKSNKFLVSCATHSFCIHHA